MPSSLPRISIVTPSFNQAPYIEWTVRSVLLQRYPALQYIVRDGGSDDGTMDILERYRDRFAFLVSEPDGGQADAVRRGFERSTGEIMGWLNSDDMLAPGALHFVASYFAANPRVDMIYSHRCMVNGENQVVGHWILPPHRNGLMMRWDLIPQETCFWRRSLFEKCGNIDASFKFALDYDLFARYMRGGGRVRRVNRFLGAFRFHRDSKTSQLFHSIGVPEIERVRCKHKIRKSPYFHLRGPLFRNRVRLRGHWHASRGRILPGTLGGVSYDYNDVWGGFLDDSRLPPLSDHKPPLDLYADARHA